MTSKTVEERGGVYVEKGIKLDTGENGGREGKV